MFTHTYIMCLPPPAWCVFTHIYKVSPCPVRVAGMSGALWTEEVRTKARLDQMLWPRMLAVAERAWHRADWEELQGSEMTAARARDWRDFANTLGYRELPRMEAMGVQFYQPPPGVT